MFRYIYENDNIEYKQEYVSDIKKEAIAFANASGGKIYIGIRKDLETIGIENPDEVMLQVANTLKDSISPDIMPFVYIKTIQINNLPVVEITVATGTNKPYYLKEKGLKPSGVYVRKGSSSQPMTDEGIRAMIREIGGKSYEEERSLRQDLTFTTLNEGLAERNYSLNTAKMQTLKLIGGDGLYTNLAYILSDQFEVSTKLAIFQGTDKAIFRNRKEFTGSVLKQLNDIYTSLDFFNQTKASFKGLKRIDSRDYPEEALREALLNAIVHRDYSISNSNIINVYDDRIEFVSLGGLVSGITLDSIFLGVSRTRNTNLANIFFRMELIESYGTGISKIQRAYNTSNKKPVFETAPGVFRVTLPNSNETAPTKEIKPQTQIKTNNTPDTETLLLEYTATNGKITRKEVEILLNIGTTKAFMLLKELYDAGKLNMQKSGRNTNYTLV